MRLHRPDRQSAVVGRDFVHGPVEVPTRIRRRSTDPERTPRFQCRPTRCSACIDAVDIQDFGTAVEHAHQVMRFTREDGRQGSRNSETAPITCHELHVAAAVHTQLEALPASDRRQIRRRGRERIQLHPRLYRRRRLRAVARQATVQVVGPVEADRGVRAGIEHPRHVLHRAGHRSTWRSLRRDHRTPRRVTETPVPRGRVTEHRRRIGVRHRCGEPVTPRFEVRHDPAACQGRVIHRDLIHGADEAPTRVQRVTDPEVAMAARRRPPRRTA